jgi:uncharacterized membrane protein YjjP (DUF1212 family)
MQRTRLNTLVEIAGGRIEELFTNPWRRIALSFISLLLGFFMGSAISTSAGQNAQWDIVAAALLLFVTELISKIVYSSDRQKSSSKKFTRSLGIDVLNLFKIGIIYSLFLEAFKLGS